MMCVAIDRYCVVKKFQPFNRKITREKTLPYIVGLIWIIASLIVLTEAITYHKDFSWISVAVSLRVILVNVLPIFTVLVSHIFLHSNLTAVSLTARARHGELPLPMPILQRKKPQEIKTHVIIVAGMSKHEELEESDSTTATENTVPSNLKNRKRLGCFMLLIAVCFFLLWAPFTACQLFSIIFEGGMDDEVLELMKSIAFLHSGLSPLLSIASMDRDWSKSTFAACRGLEVLNEHKSPSSTNEDALGPFNPRFVRPNKKANYNRRSSSVIIY
ncbi:uncharacterized protein LOC115882525 isoform X2 [Sitophilus oryzae]|nr:uncharacterized protein LOC115882525 isoform X2 [Sitophilus oryzae]XP_030756500.1 uncharacterized protein LOC115882525 isoform X2 [Sitophilus oryzae]XP_030756501.1 uncharacterized protein LOC115882525 isoform X2 [Sitophilus oryzae]